MITVICNTVAAVLYLAAGLWCGVRAVRVQRELVVLRSVKKKRKAERDSDGGVTGGNQDLLYLLEEHEKQELVDMASPLPKWLGDKTIPDLPAFDAAYLAGYALREKSWHQFKSLAAASVGGIILARYIFAPLSGVGRVTQTNRTNLLVGFLESSWHLATIQFPVLVGVFALGWSWKQKEKSDRNAFYAEILEDHARTVYGADKRTINRPGNGQRSEPVRFPDPSSHLSTNASAANDAL